METAAAIIEREAKRERRAVDLYQSDYRFRSMADSAVAQAMREHGSVDPGRADQEAHHIARAAVVKALGFALDDDAELRFLRAEDEQLRNRMIQVADNTPAAITLLHEPSKRD